eukprot:7326753-Prymnesium_polylepis.1
MRPLSRQTVEFAERRRAELQAYLADLLARRAFRERREVLTLLGLDQGLRSPAHPLAPGYSLDRPSLPSDGC